MRVLSKALVCLSLITTSSWAVETETSVNTQGTTSPTPVTAPAVPSTSPVQNGQTPVKPTASSINGATQPPAKPLTAEQIAKQKATAEANVKALVKDQANRLQQLEKANLEALSQNQELQLKNDNLGVQVQVLQSERSAQMFLYGAGTIAVGIFIGFLIASYIYTKRRRQW